MDISNTGFTSNAKPLFRRNKVRFEYNTDSPSGDE